MSIVATYSATVAMIAFVTTPALATPKDPVKVKIIDVRLVRGGSTCSTSPLAHEHPFAFPACVPSPLSLTKSFGRLGRGRVHLRVSPNTATTGGPPTIDVKVVVDLRDVRDRGTPMPNGFLTVSIPLQATEKGCSGASCPPAVRFPVSVPCGSSGGWPPGRCRIRTMSDTPVPGVVIGNTGANVEIGQIQVLDGPDVVFVQRP